MYCTGMYTGIETSTFRTGLNTGRIGHVPAIPDKFGQYRPISAGTGRTGQYKKMFLFFIFLSFVIFEFLLGQNSNLFALTY